MRHTNEWQVVPMVTLSRASAETSCNLAQCLRSARGLGLLPVLCKRPQRKALCSTEWTEKFLEKTDLSMTKYRAATWLGDFNCQRSFQTWNPMFHKRNVTCFVHPGIHSCLLSLCVSVFSVGRSIECWCGLWRRFFNCFQRYLVQWLKAQTLWVVMQALSVTKLVFQFFSSIKWDNKWLW